MRDTVLKNQTKKRALFVDLDGTIAEYIEGKQKHRKIQFRPYLKTFVKQLSKICNLYLYSFTKPTWLKSLWSKYFNEEFSDYFDIRYSFSYKKSLRAFRDLNIDILIIDDTPSIIHSDTTSFLIPIKRWQGEMDDCELLNVYSTIKARWASF